MRSFVKLVTVQFKLFLREPAAFFFTLVFPALLLTLFGIIWGNEPEPPGSPFYMGGFGYVDSEVPALAALVIGTTALMGIPIATANAREQRILRRYKATPMRPATYLAADVVTHLAIALVGMVLLVVVGKLAFDLRFGGRAPVLLAGFLLSALAFIAVGYLIASLAPTGRVAQVAGQVIYFPMMFLSGAAIPLQFMPENVRQVAEVLPMTVVVRLLQDLWFGREWYWPAALLLAGLLVVGTALSVRTFRWE
ncbi:MAG: ABC transporter permease [Chloroflexi bacterium]|nr:ABC transporter permease [Chloroflexota bacterium]